MKYNRSRHYDLLQLNVESLSHRYISLLKLLKQNTCTRVKKKKRFVIIYLNYKTFCLPTKYLVVSCSSLNFEEAYSIVRVLLQ
jgi:hypothetical protein